MKELAMSGTQPGFIMKFTAKPGARDALVAQGAKGFDLAHGVERWVICTDDEDPDAIWVIEFFDSDEAVEYHQAHQDSDHTSAVAELLAGPASFTRTAVRPVAASYPLP
jgi:quinol monooxygenase YgiN